MKFWQRWSLTLASTLLLAIPVTSCRAPQPRPAPSTSPAPLTAPPAAMGRAFRVDPAESEVRILVYRAGTLAKLGHNHVITSHDLKGLITLPEDPTQASIVIVMPVATLAVDEPDKRAEEGADFAAPVNDAAREGTHKNMMRPEVLDGERYPALAVRSEKITRNGNDFDVLFEVELRGERHELTAPVQLALDADHLRARGELAIRQTDLGIKPFTAALGALAVQDEVRVKFDIRAAVSAL
jgi:polyisoprenoid-binding protein YceI